MRQPTAIVTTAFIFASWVHTAFAEETPVPVPLPRSKVDMAGFIQQATTVARYREDRLVGLEEFLRLASLKDTLILDTRSKAAYDRKHLAGAVHLNFSDFTAAKLAKTIPSSSTRILIYCNNNVDGDNKNFPNKRLPLALNIPTFVNLYGYGYHNVYELSAFVPVDDQRLVFVGSDVQQPDRIGERQPLANALHQSISQRVARDSVFVSAPKR